MSRSFTVNLVDDKGCPISDAWARAFRNDTQVEVETQYTGASGNATFTALPDNTDCYIIALWSNKSKYFFSEATIGTTEIDNSAVTNAKIDSLAVTTAKIADLQVTTAKIATQAVSSAKIEDLAVHTAKIADLAVVESKIDDLAVTNAKINDLAVSKLTAGTMTADVIISNVFKTADSPNPRIEITGSLVAGYSDATTKQFYLQASDGVAYFAGGKAKLDSQGLGFLDTGDYLYWTNNGNTGYINYSGLTKLLAIHPGTAGTVHVNGDLIVGTIADSDLIPNNDNTKDIGSSAERWRKIYGNEIYLTNAFVSDWTQSNEFVTKVGGRLRLPTKDTTGDPSAAAPADEGDMYVNQYDNVLRLFADSAWRTVLSWT